MKPTTRYILMGAAAVLLMGIIIAVIIYITTRELKEALTKVSEDEITRTSTTATTNMKIEHKSGYNQSVRGYRNNNPLNLRISNNAWKGKIPASQNTDGAFEQFQTMAYGFRAALMNLRSYITKYNCNTIASITNKWAPSSDGNNPTRYAQVVSDRTGIAKTTVIAANDKETLCQIAAAMAYMENGSAPLMEDIYTGWNMI